MLDAFIIDEINRRKQEEANRSRIQPSIPVPERRPESDADNDDEEGRSDRGVAIIDYTILQMAPPVYVSNNISYASLPF